MAEPLADHEVTVLDGADGAVAACTCGWRSEPALRRATALHRGGSHVAERRSATWIAQAVEIQAFAQERSGRVAQLGRHAVHQRVVAGEARDRARVRLAIARRSAAALVRHPLDETNVLRHAAARLDHGRVLAGLSVPDLWIRYIALGGGLSQDQVERVLDGSELPRPTDHDLLAVALNEHFTDLGLGRPLDYWGAVAR